MSGTTEYRVGDTVKVAAGYGEDGSARLVEGRIVLIRPSNHPGASAMVAEIDVGRGAPRIAYLHDLARWNCPVEG